MESGITGLWFSLQAQEAVWAFAPDFFIYLHLPLVYEKEYLYICCRHGAVCAISLWLIVAADWLSRRWKMAVGLVPLIDYV